MKPSELYSRVPIKEDHVIKWLNHDDYCEHLVGIRGDLPREDPNERIKIKYYQDFWFDGRRFWRLASVWFDDAPVMITQNAGREGDDYARKFITNAEAYEKLVNYAQTIVVCDPICFDTETNVVADTDIPILTEFYGERLDQDWKYKQHML